MVKLFDFGLAKELKSEDKKDDGRYELTGNTGSRRYMAPEIAKELPYDKSVDIYSFGILLWEVCSAEKPFYGYSSNKHMRQVVLGGERPKMDSQHTADWPSNLQWLMKRCWCKHPSARPTFADVKQVLKDVLNSMEKLPPHLASLPSESALEEMEDEEDRNEMKSPVGGFAKLFSSPIRVRSVGKAPSMKDMKPESKSGRRKTWAFSLRR